MIYGVLIVASFIIGMAAMFAVAEHYRARIEDAMKWRVQDEARHARKALPPVEYEQTDDGTAYVPRRDRRLYDVFDDEDMQKMRDGERVVKGFANGRR